jgi:RND family efflux transporter MFP subunit
MPKQDRDQLATLRTKTGRGLVA